VSVPQRYIVELRPPRKGERYLGLKSVLPRLPPGVSTIENRWVIVDPVPADPPTVKIALFSGEDAETNLSDVCEARIIIDDDLIVNVNWSDDSEHRGAYVFDHRTKQMLADREIPFPAATSVAEAAVGVASARHWARPLAHVRIANSGRL
jgi:hypothetical protein